MTQSEAIAQATRIHWDTRLILAREYQEAVMKEEERYRTEMASILTLHSTPPPRAPGAEAGDVA